MIHDSERQRNNLLEISLGPVILEYLARNDVKEIMLNPDGRLWIETMKEGKFSTPEKFSAIEAKRVITIVASLNKKTITQNDPVISATLERYKARFQGWLPPITPQPAFCIRKQAAIPLSMDDWVNQKSMSVEQAESLVDMLKNKKNIIICGGTGSGKTTLVNSLLHIISQTNERIILIEDTPELHINSQDHVNLLTTPTFSMRDCLAGTLRMRPDRIIIGEVRDGAALDLLKAWNTGHDGGIATLHANSASGALQRLEDLAMEATPQPPHRLISQVINTIVFMGRSDENIPVLRSMTTVQGYKDGHYILHERIE